MDMRRLAMLRELADHGLVGEVADVFGITPSAVSQQLKLLEREAGVPLTEPAGRGIALTSAGRELSRRARSLSAHITQFEGEWREYIEQPVGDVSMSLFASSAEMFLPGLLATLGANVNLKLEATDADPTNRYSVPDLALKFDIVVADSPTQDERWRQLGLVSVPLMTEPLDIAMPRGHHLTAKRSLRPADVIEETWIGAPKGFPFDRLLQQIESATGHRATVAQRFNDNSITESLVQAGHGIAILPRYTTRVHAAKFAMRPLRGIESSRDILAVMRPDRMARPAVREVVKELKTEATAVAQRLKK